MSRKFLLVILTHPFPAQRGEGTRSFVAEVKPRFDLEPFDQFCKEPLPEAQWLIEGIFERDSQVVLWGEPGCGKSFVALSWAIHVATGEKWLGVFNTFKGPVIYCVGEGERGTRRRGAAARLEYGFSEIKDLHFLSMAPRLRDPKVLDEFMKLVKRIQPVLVIIDTLARSMTGDENSAEHMNDWLNAAALIQHETKACVQTLHHTAKNVKKGGKPTERGSGALRGAMDTSIQVRGGECITLHCVKQKDEVPFADINLHLKGVTLVPGTDEKRALTSAVIVPFEETIPERILAGSPQENALLKLQDAGPLTADEWQAKLMVDGKMPPYSTFRRWVKKLEDEELIELELETQKWRVKKSYKTRD